MKYSNILQEIEVKNLRLLTDLLQGVFLWWLWSSLASLNYDLRHNLDSCTAHQTLERLFEKMNLVTRLLEVLIFQCRFWCVSWVEAAV